MSERNLKILAKLLAEFSEIIRKEQPLAAQVINMVRRWVIDFIELP